MSKKRETRRQFTDHQKASMVARAARIGSIAEAAEKMDISSGTLARWTRDPRYAGVNTVKGGGNGLPTKQRKSQKRTRALVATSFVCPHCGGPISKGA